jgi:hypothetical protein
MAKSTPRRTKTAKRRPYEYDHQYGLGSGTKKAAPTRASRRVSKTASTRTKAR